ncbi:MAG: MarR family winged helix-turn-helix transcriptional regulator [Bacteroidia bacterium]
MKIEEAINQKKFRSEQQKAILNLYYTVSWIEKEQKKFFKKHNVTMQQYNVLNILKSVQPEKISTSDIKKRLTDSNPDVSRMVDRLEALKLITKKTNKNDKRLIEVSITTKGLQLVDKLNKNISKLDEVLKLSSKDAKELNKLLDKARGVK